MSLSYLCKAAAVSRSGFYCWLNRDSNQRKKDIESYILIQKIAKKRNYKLGIRRLKMEIERCFEIRINLKRIARIKRIFCIPTLIRKKSKISQGMKRSSEVAVKENLLNQDFKVTEPRTVYSTDVTYLINKNGRRAYLSAVKDLCTNEIVGHAVSGVNDLEFVLSSVKKAIGSAEEKLIIHSDQGFQYTSPAYQHFLDSRNIIQSMSRKGNCLDNAPIESFFGHMKDECDYKSWKSIEELRLKIGRYIKYYNEKRPQWGLKRKTPVEYRSLIS